MKCAIHQGIHNEILLAFPSLLFIIIFVSVLSSLLNIYIRLKKSNPSQRAQDMVCQLHSWFLFVYGLTVICMDFSFYVFFLLCHGTALVYFVQLGVFDRDCTQYALQCMRLHSFTHIFFCCILYRVHYSMHVIFFNIHFGDNSQFFSFYMLTPAYWFGSQSNEQRRRRQWLRSFRL